MFLGEFTLSHYGCLFLHSMVCRPSHVCTLGWWHGVVVTRFIRSTKLLYARPG